MNRCPSVPNALMPRRFRGLYYVRYILALCTFGFAASAQVASNSATGLSYASVQAAVDAWGSNYTVHVLANTAASVVVNNKTNLLIVGTNNVSPFRITGAGTGTGLMITNRSRNVAVSNLVIERFAIGVAIDRCESNEINLIVRSNQNSASAGAGVHLNYATNNIIGGFIYYNTNISGANSYGGAGVYAQYSVSNTVRALVASNLVTNTTGVPSGGGIYIVNGRFNTVSGDVVANQISNSVGGGIDIDYGFGNVITGNVIRNGSFNGGGIYLYYCTNTTINASVDSNTSAAGGGAGICMLGSVSNTVIGSVVGNIGTNASYYCYGSGIQMKSCFSNYINVNISYNRGGDDGAAIYGSNVHFNTVFVAMTNNTANNGSGGGIYFDCARSNSIAGTAVGNICSNGFGGGIGLSSAQSNRITLDCYGNIANSGGAVFLDYCTNTYVSNVMVGNFSPQGSGAYIWYGRSNDFYGTACSNSDWEGFYSSGAFTFANAQSNIVNCDIFDNRLVSSWALGGGAIYCSNAQGNLLSGSYMRNSVDASGSSGGAVYLRYSDNNVITASLLSNVAQFGGGICLDYGKTNAIDGYSYGNMATNGGALYAYVSSNVTVRGTYGGSESFRTFFLQSALFGHYSNVSVVDDRSTMSVFYMTNATSGKFLDSVIIAPEATVFDVINTSNCIFSNCLIASSPADAFIFSNAGTNSILFCTITNNRGGIAHSASSSNRIYNNNISNVMMNLVAGAIGSYAASNWYGTRTYDGMRLVKTNYGITPWRNAFGGRNGDWVLPPPPGGCVAATNATLGQIVIKWGLSAPADFSNYQVYRTLSESFSNLTDADRVFIGFNSAVTQYTENAVPGGVYRYYVTTADTNGNESMYSPMGIVTNNTIVASNASIGGTFTNLQLAINAAAAGNTIVVYRTRHIGNFIIDKNLTLRSRDWIDFGDKTKTTIESPNLTTDPLMLSNVTPITVTVEGFHISKGSTGIRVQSGVTANILNNVICSNESRGVLLNIGSAYCTVVSNHIFSNSAQNYTGNGVYLNTNFGGARVDHNVIHNNNGDTPYGIFARSCSNLVQIRYNTVVSNISARTNTGGGIRIEDTFSEIIGNTIQYTGSNACEGGGIVISNIAASTNFIADNIITHHLASNYSYGIYVITNAPASLMTISNNSISSNGLSVSSNLRARGIFVAAGGGTYIISDNTIAENHDRINCGGIGVHFNTGTTANAVIERNTIVRSGQSGITAFSSGSMTIRGNIVRDSGINMSLASGSWEAFGIYAAKSSALIIDGNTVTGTTSINVTNVYGISVGTNATIINNIIVSNMPPTTKYAVGLDLYGPSHFSLVSNNRIAYNIGTNTGYGIQVFASVPASNRIVNNVIINNRDFGVFMSGTNRGSVISSNNVSANGGYGIYIGITASSNRITGNSIAGNRYAGIMLNNAAVATNYICSNIISGPGQEEGINLSSCPSNLIFRNVIANHLRGVSVVMANSNDIFNNTMYNNGTGIDWSTASNVRIVNNIIFGSTNVGVYDSGASGGAEINYTVFYNNALGDTNISARHKIGPSNVSGANPYVDTFGMYDITSPLSMAVDRATNIPGITSTFLSNGPDMGWRESLFSADQALVVCSITNPPANQWIGTPVMSFSGTAGASVTGVYFGTNSSLSLVSGTAVWTTNGVDVSAFSNGTNVFFVAASNAGGTLFTNVQTNYFDFTPPEIVFTAPTPLTVISNVVTYQGSNVDPFAPVTGFWFNVNGGAWTSVAVESNWSGDIDTTTFPNGLFIVGIRSSNAAGLVSYASITNYAENIPSAASVYKYPTNSLSQIWTYTNDGAFGAAPLPASFGFFAGEGPFDNGAWLNAEDAAYAVIPVGLATYSGFRYKVLINESPAMITNIRIRWKGFTGETPGAVSVWRSSSGTWMNIGAVPPANAIVQSDIGPGNLFITNEGGKNYLYVIADAAKTGGAGTLSADYFEVGVYSSPGLPMVNNTAGASAVTNTMATLRGALEYDSGVNTTVFVFYGTNNGGTVTANWSNVIDMGTLAVGGFATNITGLLPLTAYYYRTMVSNSYGTNWSPATSNFTTAADPPIVASNSATGLSYTSVQAAIDASALNYTVYVYSNTASPLYITGKSNLTITTNGITPYPVLSGNGTNSGIVIYNATNITLSWLRIQEWTNGVVLTNSPNCKIVNCSIQSNTFCGIYLNGANSTNIFIVSNELSGPSQWGGVRLDNNASRNFILSNKINNHSYGALYITTANNTAAWNSIYSNASYQVLIQNGTGNVLASNSIELNATGCYIMSGSHNNRLVSNVMRGLTTAISIVGATNSQIINNNIYSNTTVGVEINSAGVFWTIVASNSIWGGNQPKGISFHATSKSNWVYLNTICSNQIYGIYLNMATNNQIYLNNMFGQRTNIAYLPGDSNIFSNNYYGSMNVTEIIATNHNLSTNLFCPYRFGVIGTHQADVVAPNEPVITNAANVTGGVALWWTNTGADIGGYRVYRSFINEWTNFTSYLTNIETAATAFCYTDMSASSAFTNYYFVTAYDTNTNAGQFINETWFGVGTNGIALLPPVITVSNRNSIGTFYSGFSTIQAGITAATNGDTVFVMSNGVYNEQLKVVSKTNIALVSWAWVSNTNRATTVIDAMDTNAGTNFFMQNAVGVTIEGFTIQGARYGVFLTTGSMSNVIANNRIYSNRTHGITLDRSFNTVASNDIEYTIGDRGIQIGGGDSNVIVSNRIFNNNLYGIFAYGGAAFNRIEQNVVYSNGSEGILLNSGSDISNTIASNTVYGCIRGIYLNNASYNTLRENTLYGNSSAGIYCTGATNNLIENSRIYSNAFYGIYLSGAGASGNVIRSNHCFSADQDDGIRLVTGAFSNTLVSNRLEGNSSTGIVLLSASNNSIIANTVSSNGIVGIYLEQSGAFGNVIAYNSVLGLSAQGYGIVLSNGAGSNSIATNVVSGHSKAGVYLLQATNSGVGYNTIVNNLNGVFALQGSNVSVQYNNLTNNLTNFAAAGNMTPVWIESNYYGTRTASNAQVFGLIGNPDPWVNSYMNFFGDWTPPRTATNGGASNNAAGDVVVWWEPINTNSDFSNWMLFRTTTNAYSNLTDADMIASIPYSNATAMTDTPPAYGNYWYYLAVRDTNGNEAFYVPTAGVAAVYAAPVYAASNTNTGSNYMTIQAAVNAAGTNETIVVFPGTYHEEIVMSFKSGVSIIGYAWLTNNDIAATVLDGAGTSNVGVYADRVTNCTIAGLSIAQYSNGIYMLNSRSNTIGYNRFASNVVAGISLWSGDHWNTIMSNEIRAVTNLHGIYLSASSSNLICSNSIGESTNGVTIANTSIYNEIRQNTIYSNIDGVNLSSGTAAFTRVVSNDIAGNYNRGVVLPATPSATIAFNTVHGCVNPNYAAITVGNSALQNFIGYNTVYDNGGSGIGGNYPNALSNSIVSNAVSNNARYGIHLGSSAVNTVVSNRIASNALSGIYASNSMSNIIYANVIEQNGTNGMRIIDSSAGLIAGNLITNNYTAGIVCAEVSFMRIFSNTIVKNDIDTVTMGISMSAAAAAASNEIAWNTIAANGEYGISAAGAFTDMLIASNSCTGHSRGITAANMTGTRWIANTLVSNFNGVYLSGVLQSNVFRFNGVSNNTGYAFQFYALTGSGGNDISYNDITANPVGLYHMAVQTNYASFNNIAGNSTNTVFSNGYANNWTNNWWGGINAGVVAGGITDATNTNNYAPYRLGVIGVTQADTAPPSVPTGVAAVGTAAGNIVTWNDMSGSGAVGYRVYRSGIDTWTNFSTYHTNLGAVTSYTDSSAAVGVSNFYFVTAFDSAAVQNESFFGTSAGAARLSAVASNSATGLTYGSVQAAVDAATNNYSVFLLTNADAFVVSGKTNLAIRPSTAFNRITGAGTGNAVVISNSAGVSVSGLVIHGWMNGIVIGVDVSGAAVSNMSVVSNAGAGIVISNAEGTTLFANAVCSNVGDGIRVVSDMSNVRIDSNNVFMNGGIGLSITATNGVTIVSNEIISNGNNVSVVRVLNGVMARNLIALSSGYGVYAESGASNLVLVNNTLAGNAWNALDVQNSATVYTTNNIFYANGQYGIQDGNLDASRHDYNNFHANSWGVANMMLGGGTITGDPHLDQSVQFQITNAAGRAVDAGISNSYSAAFTGYAPDIGWRESPYSGTPAASNTNTGAVYMTVAGAVNAAGNGHTVAVLAGTHAEKRITIEKDLTVIGWPWFTNGNNAGAVFDGGVSDYIFQVTNAHTVNIYGLTISNSGMGGNGHVQYSGGAAGRVVSNRIGWGMNYAVKITDARPEVSGNYIENMQGVGISGLSPAVVVSNHITGGTGIQCNSLGATNWRIAYNRIISNWTAAAFSMGNAAGGVFMSNIIMSNASAITVNDMSNLTFIGNTVTSNGVGVSLSFSVSNVALEGGVLSNNSNAIYLDGAVSVAVQGASIVGNGTAFAATNVSAVTFTSNTVAWNAGAIVLNDVSNTVFYLNHIASNAAGIVLTNGSTANVFRLNDVYSNATNVQYIAGNAVASNYFGSMLYADVLAGVTGTSDTNVLAPYRFGYIGTAQSDTAAPAAPQFTAVTNMMNGIALYWNNTGGDTVGYRIYRSVSNDAWTNFSAYFTNIVGAAVTAVTDTTVSVGATNYYFVTAYDGAAPYLNESWFSVSTNGVRLAPSVTLSFTNPAPIAWITNTPYTIQGWASNDYGQLAGVWFSTNAATGYNLASGTTNWTTNVNVSTFPITNVFYAVASNEYGYVTTNHQTNLVDTTLPYAALTNVTSGGYVSGVFTFRGTNYDAQSGIFGTRIVITNTAGAVANIDGMQNTLEFTNNWNSGAVADGRYFAYVSTTNGAGMLSNGASTMFVVNNLLPQIIQTNITQLGTNTGNIAFIGYATNAYAGIDPAAVYMMTNGGAYSFITNGTNFATNFNSTLVGEGTNIFIFAAVSSNFKTNTWYQTNIIDNSAPISVVTNYVHGSVIAGAVNIRGTNFENWSSVTANVLYTNDAFFGWTAATAPWSFALNTASFTNGVMKLALITSNGVGLTFTNTWSNYVSNTGPTLAFTNPAPMVWITNTSYSVQGWASNTVGELYGVWFSTNAATGYNLASGTTNWTTNVNMGTFPITNVFYAVASNEYGYLTTNHQTNLVDTTLPYAALTNVTSGGYVSGVFTFRGTNYDAQSGIFGTRIVITNTAGAVANIDGLQNTLEFTNQWNSGGVADGRYFAYVSTTNGAGMLSNGASTMFVVNNLLPQIIQTNITQLGTNTGNIAFIGYATNAYAGIDPAAVYMMTNGGAYSFITNGTNFATNFNSTLVGEGTNIFIFAAVSSNFKTNTWYQTNIIDNSAPISVVTNYVHNSVIAGTVNVRGTNSENWSAVTANVLYTNDAFFGWTAATAPWSFALNTASFTNGVMKLALVTSNGVGLTFTNTWSNYVSNGAVIAAFTSDKTNVYTYTVINFSDLSTSGLSITNWLWSFGDGYTTNYTAFVPVIAHTYTQMTTCWVTLTVWDTLGSNTVSNQYVISNQLPIASFTRSAASAAPFITNYFTNISTDADGVITNFRWEFGDGVISNGASFSNMAHRYTNGGSFSVVLTVWDNNGGMASNTSIVTIGEYAAYFVIYGTNAVIAGDTNEITMIACAPDDSRASYFSGYKSMTFGGALNAPDGTTPKTEGISFGGTVFVYFTNGYATNLDFTMALYRAGAWTITASDGVASTQPAGTNVFTVTVSPGDMHKDTSVISASPRPGSVNTNVRVTISGYDAYKNKTAIAAVPAVTVTVSGSNSATPAVVYAGSGNYTADYTPTAAGEDIVEAYLGGIKILADADGTSDGIYHLPISALETARITDLAKKARDVTHGGAISVFSSKNPAVRGERIDIYYEVATNSIISIGIYDMSGKLVNWVIENKQSDVPGVNIAYNVPVPATRGLYLVAYTSIVNGVTQRIYWKLLVK